MRVRVSAMARTDIEIEVGQTVGDTPEQAQRRASAEGVMRFAAAMQGGGEVDWATLRIEHLEDR